MPRSTDQIIAAEPDRKGTTMNRSTPTTAQLTAYRDELWNRSDSRGGYGAASAMSLDYARQLFYADQDRSEALVATRARQAEARRQRQAVRDAQRGVGEDLPPETYEEAILRATVEGLEGLRTRFLTEPLAVHRQYAWEAIESSVSTIVSAESWEGVDSVEVKADAITVHMTDGTRVETIVPEDVKTWGPFPDVTLHMAVWNILMSITSKTAVAA